MVSHLNVFVFSVPNETGDIFLLELTLRPQKVLFRGSSSWDLEIQDGPAVYLGGSHCFPYENPWLFLPRFQTEPDIAGYLPIFVMVTLWV